MGKKKDQQPISNKDINDIFKSIKKQEKPKQNISEQSKNDSNNQKPKVQKSQNSQPTQNTQKNSKNIHKSNQQQSKVKYTEEGYKVYNTEELKIGKGGNTNLCPFDCECCF